MEKNGHFEVRVLIIRIFGRKRFKVGVMMVRIEARRRNEEGVLTSNVRQSQQRELRNFENFLIVLN